MDEIIYILFDILLQIPKIFHPTPRYLQLFVETIIYCTFMLIVKQVGDKAGFMEFSLSFLLFHIGMRRFLFLNNIQTINLSDNNFYKCYLYVL